jgi:hypothetical protein
MLPVHYRVFKEYIYSFLTCSQIWPSPLVEDHNSPYFTREEEEEEEKKNTLLWKPSSVGGCTHVML